MLWFQFVKCVCEINDINFEAKFLQKKYLGYYIQDILFHAICHVFIPMLHDSYSYKTRHGIDLLTRIRLGNDPYKNRQKQKKT